MLDQRFIRDHSDLVREGLEKRDNEDVYLDEYLELDAEWRELKSRGDDLRHKRNETSTRISELHQEGKSEEAEEVIDQSKELKDEIEAVEDRAAELEEELEERRLRIPNPPHKSVTVGEDEEDNVELRREGFDDLRKLPSTIIPHYDLGEELGIIDEKRARKTSGSGFYFLKGDGARLEHALVQFMMDIHREQGYIDVFPPILTDSDSMTGTGQLPKFSEDAYDIAEEDLWLCPTAEVPVTNMHREEILLSEELPLKYQAYTPNFRREAGEHGTATRGIVRVHQFNKVEMVNFVTPENSYDDFDRLLDEAEEVLRRLDLPYRTLELCTGDLGFKAAKQIDFEVWAPADDMESGPEQGGRWLEVSTVSNFEDFQARRAGIQYRPEHHESAETLHTLNASGLALPRVMVAILEYYQNEDGTVTIPEALRPYMGGQEIIEGHDSVGESTLGTN